MPNFNAGSPGFVRYAESFMRLSALRAELDQENAINRQSFRACIVDWPEARAQENLGQVFAYLRHRGATRS